MFFPYIKAEGCLIEQGNKLHTGKHVKQNCPVMSENINIRLYAGKCPALKVGSRFEQASKG